MRPAPQGTPHPLWTDFLEQATSGDKELQRYLKQRAGYWLTGRTHREDFDFFWGPGGSGKGTFLRTISSDHGRLRQGRPDRAVHGLEDTRRTCASSPAWLMPAS